MSQSCASIISNRIPLPLHLKTATHSVDILACCQKKRYYNIQKLKMKAFYTLTFKNLVFMHSLSHCGTISLSNHRYRHFVVLLMAAEIWIKSSTFKNWILKLSIIYRYLFVILLIKKKFWSVIHYVLATLRLSCATHLQRNPYNIVLVYLYTHRQVLCWLLSRNNEQCYEVKARTLLVGCLWLVC